MYIVSKIRTVGKVVEAAVKQLACVDVPEKVVSKAEFIETDKTVHALARISNQLNATIATAKAPLLEQIQKIDAETVDTRTVISDGIESAKSLMTKYFERFPSTTLEAGTTMAVVRDIEVLDISVVPAKYFAIAKAAILKDISAGTIVPGVKITSKYQVRITEKQY